MQNVYPFNGNEKSNQKLLKPVGFSRVYLPTKTSSSFQLLPAKTATMAENKSILWAVAAYILFVIPMFFVPKQNEFVWFHIRQSFGIFVASLVIYLVEMVFGLYILAVVLNIALFGIWCIAIVNVFQYKQKTLPVIGNASEKYKVF